MPPLLTYSVGIEIHGKRRKKPLTPPLHRLKSFDKDFFELSRLEIGFMAVRLVVEIKVLSPFLGGAVGVASELLILTSANRGKQTLNLR